MIDGGPGRARRAVPRGPVRRRDVTSCRAARAGAAPPGDRARPLARGAGRRRGVHGRVVARRCRACARYVAVDGGMADNIRPALYGAILRRPARARRARTARLGDGDDRREVLRVGRHPDPRHRAAPAATRATCSRSRWPAHTPWRWRATTTSGAAARRRARPRRGQRGSSSAARRTPTCVRAGRSSREKPVHGADDGFHWPAPSPSTTRSATTTSCSTRSTGPTRRTPTTVRRMCDRHRGVGADGVLWGPVGPRSASSLRLFNPDGSEFEKSGNGLRIFARYLWDQGLPTRRDFDIRTPVGAVTAHMLDEHGEQDRDGHGRRARSTAAAHRPATDRDRSGGSGDRRSGARSSRSPR